MVQLSVLPWLLAFSAVVMMTEAGYLPEKSANKPLLWKPKDNNTKKQILGQDDHDHLYGAEFQEFKVKYNKKYSSYKENVRRYQIFMDNMRRIDKLNANKKDTASYGVTEFADMSQEEFRRTHLTPQWDLSAARGMEKADIPALHDVPQSFDWREHNTVSPVKNQGSCGSCWAFSTTGNIEGQWAMKKGRLLSLSEQELVDCDKVDQGCNGGLPTQAYKAIQKLGGLETEKDYPYEGEDDKCEFNKREVSAYINSSVSISSNEEDMKAWLAKNGPISIGINAFAMQFYFGGVSDPFSFLCNPDELDHGVLIVGYGVDNGWFSKKPYWIVKNSWGSSWGEKGYYRVYRGKGVCGVNKMPTSAVVN